MTAPVRPADPYVSEAELAKALHVVNPSSEELTAACWAATDSLSLYLGQSFDAPAPDGVHLAALQLAVRYFTATDVARGTYATDLGTGFTGRFVTPEIEGLLIGLRVTFGVA